MPTRRTRPVARLLALPLLLALLSAPAQAEDADEGAGKVGLQLEGRLGSQTVTREGEKRTLYVIKVGKTTYELDTAGVKADALRKARGKYVAIRAGAPQAPADDGPRGVLASSMTLELQPQAGVAGTVRTASQGKKTVYALETNEGLWQIAPSAVRHFKAFVGRHVQVACFRVTDGRYRALDKVKRVVRKLLPGERDPNSGEDAIGGGWKGALTVVEVPRGVPGARTGDFAISFRSSAALAKTEGTFTNVYKIVGVRARKFSRKKRKAVVELAYSFGQGSHAITLKGTYGPDWKTFSGTWKSGFLGHGTFTLAVDERSSKSKK
jgi:hypothetical protein